ncbi:MAG: C40 family peptidase [Fulvivirga sp.]|uniref:C40 family peptidase n=1 Tax=Fulvivirga sp. TaxID=1931237 RepID=UPI0032EE6D72
MEIGNKGISRLSVIQVRASHSDKAEVVTQLLFGDHYTVTGISDDKKWIRVQIYYDKYEGWIDAKQHTDISEAYFDQINNADYKICTDITSTILYKKHHTTIVIGSILPIATNEIFKVEEQLAFNGEAKSLGAKRDGDFLKQIAFKYLNAPYQWGGRSPFGIDCSGFTQNVFRICGYDLQRDAWQQEKAGTTVDFRDIQLGDLAFFKNKEGKIVHVGIALEDNQIIHASGKVRVDTLTSEGIVHAETSKLTHTLTSIKRILRD